jgi:uncharacterized SAM-binding protein YcdF (DUF218 family)
MVSAISYSFLLSPLLLLVTATIGVAMAFRWRRAGLVLALASLVAFDLMATPAVADRMARAIELGIPGDSAPGKAPAAIVVLGADVGPRERDGRDGLGRLTLERLAFAAREYRAARLPILVSGGVIKPARTPLADIMARILEDDFGLAARWREERSRNTWENAEFSAEILKANDISTVILVAQAVDMRRAVWSFKRCGIEAVPARSTPTTPGDADELRDFLPSPGAVTESFIVLHEAIGLLYYRVVH